MKKAPRKTVRKYQPYKAMSPFRLTRDSVQRHGGPRLTKTQFRAAIRKARDLEGNATMSTNELRHWIEKGDLL